MMMSRPACGGPSTISRTLIIRPSELLRLFLNVSAVFSGASSLSRTSVLDWLNPPGPSAPKAAAGLPTVVTYTSDNGSSWSSIKPTSFNVACAGVPGVRFMLICTNLGPPDPKRFTGMIPIRLRLPRVMTSAAISVIALCRSAVTRIGVYTR